MDHNKTIAKASRSQLSCGLNGSHEGVKMVCVLNQRNIYASIPKNYKCSHVHKYTYGTFYFFLPRTNK